MTVYNGNCLELLRMLPDNSVDSIVTDPPYGLSFMGKKWDYDVPSVEIWEECLRVLKPGGHMLAFAGTRTQHRMAVRIEDAGFEIRDMIAWVYGSGFPKSLDVSKAIDKAAGAEREVIGIDEVALKRSAAVGTAAYGDYKGQSGEITAPATPAAQQWNGWGTALKPALEPITVARKPLAGTVANNVLQYGTGAINIDGGRVGDEVTGWGGGGSKLYDGGLSREGGQARPVEGRWPANLMHDGSDEVTGLLNDAARFFYCPKASKADRNYGCGNLPDTTAADMVDREPDSDGMNSPRAGAGRTSGAKNNHPTVKPIELMRYLCRLVTPPNGVVLDPFTGSGSTGVAATLEHFQFLGAEMDPNFHKIASARLQQANADIGANTVITLIEYTTSDSKPTGRICRIPDVSRPQLTDLLMLYGFTGEYGEYTGRLEAYHPAHWCFVYNGSMGHHPGEQVELYELIAP